MNNPIATLGQIGQLATRFATYLKGDEVRPMFNRASFGQLLSSKYRIKACYRALASVLATYANAVNPFASDAMKKEKQTNFYPKGWKMVSLKGQLDIIQVQMPGLRCSEAFLSRPRVLPAGSDGFGLFPKGSALVRELAESLGLTNAYGTGENGADYGKLIKHVLGLIANQRKLHNYRKDALGPKQVWLEERVRAILLELEAEDPDEDFIILPVTLGNSYAGCTPCWSCEDMLLANSLPLPALHVGWALYTNPDRFTEQADLWIDCSGDRHRAVGDVYCLDFILGEGAVRFSGRYLDVAYGYCGSASASLSGVPGNL